MKMKLLLTLLTAAFVALGATATIGACPTCALSSANELPNIPTNRDISALITNCAEGQCLGQDIGAVNGEAKLRFFCEHTHLRYDDPIVNPGEPGAAHLHHFFGNDMAAANSTYESLRTSGEGSCQGGILNRSAYWFPAMIDGARNKVVIPRMIEWYYRMAESQRWLTQPTPGEFTSPNCPALAATIACPTYGNRDIPKGLKMIAGANASGGSAGTITDGTNYYWTCQTLSGNILDGTGLDKRVFWDPVTPSNGLPNCTSTNTGSTTLDGAISLVLETNRCWNGNLDHADHRSHFKDTISDGIATQVCPATHPYIIPHFILTIQWDIVTDSTDYRNWYLSSDRHNGANFRPGETFHTDMFWAWDDPAMEVIRNFIWALDGVQDHRTCASGCLGNGTRLLDNNVDEVWLDPSVRYMDIPKRGGSKGRIKVRVR